MWQLVAAERSFWDWAVLALGIAAIIGGSSIVFLQSRSKEVSSLKQDTIDAQAVRIKQLEEEVERLKKQ